MEQQEQAAIKAKISEVRGRYARLMSACGRNHISRATTEDYARELLRLEAMLN